MSTSEGESLLHTFCLCLVLCQMFSLYDFLQLELLSMTKRDRSSFRSSDDPC